MTMSKDRGKGRTAARKGTGILGGTFDPIHIGHLAVAEAARIELGLETVLFVPARHQPHKLLHQVAPAEHRWEMVCRAVRHNRTFVPCRLELDREGPSYTFQTVAELKAIFGDDSDLFFICGADALLEMDTWYRPGDLLATASVGVARRPGWCGDAELEAAQAHLEAIYNARITAFEAPLIDISSTMIRQRHQQGKSIRYLVTEPVLTYIRQHRLYREELSQGY